MEKLSVVLARDIPEPVQANPLEQDDIEEDEYDDLPELEEEQRMNQQMELWEEQEGDPIQEFPIKGSWTPCFHVSLLPMTMQLNLFHRGIRCHVCATAQKNAIVIVPGPNIHDRYRHWPRDGEKKS